jgi:hypothetical protein
MNDSQWMRVSRLVVLREEDPVFCLQFKRKYIELNLSGEVFTNIFDNLEKKNIFLDVPF